MAKVVGDIAVEVSADIGPLQRGMKAGSLSVQQFSDDFEARGKRIERISSRIAASIGLITVAVGAMASTAKMTVEFTREIEELSYVAGVSAERFQTLSYAARQYGIDQNKLSDILKDVNDKMGDFLSTGAGPMQDFFDNIAPKVGVTADQFRRLNSADALQLYVESLQKANVSQAEMTFYMEALANDATRLVPLLSDSASEMKRLEENARDLGIVLSEDLVARSSRMARIWDSLVSQMRAKFVAFASTVLVGLDAIFGITDEGTLMSLNRKLDSLVDERNEILSNLGDIDGRTDNPITRGHRKQSERLLEDTEAEMASIAEQMTEIKRGIEKRNEAEKRLREALNQPDPGINEPSGDDVPDVKTGGGGGGGGRRASSAMSDHELDRLKESFATEREVIQADYEEKMAMLQEFLEAKKVTQEEYHGLVEKLQSEHNERMAKLEGQKRDAMMQGLSGMFGDLSSLMRSENDKLFKIGQAAAIAQATVSGYQAAVDAWQKGMKIGGPPVAAAFTAASLARTGALISSIASTSSSGGGGGGSGGAGAAGAQAAPAPLDVRISGLTADSIMRGSDVGALLDRLTDEAGDRGLRLTVAQ